MQMHISSHTPLMYPYVTIQIVTIGAKVMAFEPLPSSAGLLRASLRFNDGGNHGGTTGTGSYWVHLGPQASKPLRKQHVARIVHRFQSLPSESQD